MDANTLEAVKWIVGGVVAAVYLWFLFRSL